MEHLVNICTYPYDIKKKKKKPNPNDYPSLY